MSGITDTILNLIKMGRTVNEISEITKLSHKQIYNLLNTIGSKGFEFDRKYYSSGDLIYVPRTSFARTEHEGVDIITGSKENTLEALVISDLHIGSVMERIDLLNKLYDYCAKEGIHIIIVCGDVIDGTFGRYPGICNNISEQIDYALKNYPFDKDILNFMLFGDHDYSALKKFGQNLSKVFDCYRHDIVSLGYGIGQINVKNDIIIVKHPSDEFSDIKYKSYNKCLLLSGHSHKMKVQVNPNMTTVNIPTISDLTCSTEAQIPSVVRMSLELKNGVIFNGTFSQLIFRNGFERVCEFDLYLGQGKDISGNDKIRLEEERTKKKTLILSEKTQPMSQIEKFNARFGNK